MFGLICIIILFLSNCYLIYRNTSDRKENQLATLDLENKIKSLENKLEESEVHLDKAEQMVEALSEDPDISFKYNTIFGSPKSKGMRDKLVSRTKEIGYSIGRSYAVWSLQEDKALEHRFKVENKSVLQLAVIHERTITAISRRLKSLGLL